METLFGRWLALCMLIRRISKREEQAHHPDIDDAHTHLRRAVCSACGDCGRARRYRTWNVDRTGYRICQRRSRDTKVAPDSKAKVLGLRFEIEGPLTSVNPRVCERGRCSEYNGVFTIR